MTEVKRQHVLAVLCMSVLVAASLAAADSVRCVGMVADGEGQAVDGADVALYELVTDGLAGGVELHQLGQTATAADGGFALEAEPNPTRQFIESYVVAHKKGLALGWTVWKMQADAEFTIELDRPETLAGTIVDEAGQPVPDADVRAHLSRSAQVDGEERRQWLPGIGPMQVLARRTGNRGVFAFDNLPVGVDVDLLVTAPGRVSTYSYQQELRTSAFKVGQTDIAITVPKEARIEGRILDAYTGQGAAGAKVGLVGTFSSLFYDRHVVTTDPNGDFSFRGLKAGRYRIAGNHLPRIYVETKLEKTEHLTIRINKLYHGRVFFDDDTPAVIVPPPFPRAGTEVRLIRRGGTWKTPMDTLDDDGYFSVYLSDEQFELAQAGQVRLYVYMRYRENRGEDKAIVSVVDLLATDKARAGIVTVPRPHVQWLSLAGCAVPPLNRIGHATRQDQAEDKRLVVCFFDMNQRPSRHTLVQLDKKSEMLAERGVLTLAVQTPKVEEDTLDKWLQRNNVSLPVGLAAGSDEQARYTWGVKSLPWLILTDTKHIVTAEGFAVSELGDKIE